MSEMSSELLLLKEKAKALLVSREKEARFSWPKEFKAEIVKSVQKGMKRIELSKATGVPYETLCGWVQKDKRVKEKGSFKRLNVVKRSTLRVLSRKGFEVQGLSFEELQILFQKDLL